MLLLTERAAPGPSAQEKAWAIAATVCDPEIPVLSIADLGILRSVELFDDGGAWPAVRVVMTPTYSGCPAVDTIRDDLYSAFARAGYPSVHVELALAPAWTTDWMTEEGRAKLAAYGIAPPSGRSQAGGHSGAVRLALSVKCPQCSSLNTREITRFGSTSCKALYVCQDCREPFDYFKVL
ncbi:1,2-phenylacetyl-CoA epoxidase subunit PaaD [Arthrobacter sp. 35W]|uniref:1,2-phenylacetyl-CoA epoxidase subunit PaaD n=1 Tax=Arthrobacter sp. 35W TaxID=1132441 RepID=UPI0004244B41|nr:1,2-phenylacetyl-CoA epoxidase subunit PaaD [Arthrobacter sp. 35W]